MSSVTHNNMAALQDLRGIHIAEDSEDTYHQCGELESSPSLCRCKRLPANI